MIPNHTQDEMFYRIRWRGQISGPFAMDQIDRMIRTGKLSRHHEISLNGQRWRTLEKSGLMGQPSVLNRPAAAARCDLGLRNPPDLARLNPALTHNEEMPKGADGVGAGTALYCADNAIGSAGHHRTPLSAKRGLALVVFGVTPLAISFLQGLLTLSFAQVAWLFSTYFCVMWGWIISLLAAWRSEIWKKGLLCSVFTCSVGIAMLFIWKAIPWVAGIEAWIELGNPVIRLVGWIFGVGALEELCKAAPLLLFCLGPGIIRSRNDGLLLGLLSGLGFAVNEGVNYTMRYWSAAVGIGAERIQQCVEAASNWAGMLNQEAFEARLSEMLPSLFEQYGELVAAQLIRFMALPLLHAAWAALVGYAIAISLIQRRWGVMWLGLGIAAVLHGAYNFFSGSIYGVGIAGTSLGIPMLLYARNHVHAGKEIYG
ncbi:MAG: PrsW family intramembrane metalloprotease [Spartobacteria bacterium]|nr:PrsW family intramembrane metalloprotease [Spartobacteria bacterium]